MSRLSARFRGWKGPVTRAGLDRLRDQLSKPVRLLNLTIGGSIEEAVHIDVDGQKRALLRSGEKKLTRASDTVQRDHRLTALCGLTKQQLNKAVQKREHRTQVQSANRQRSVARSQNR